MSVANGFSVPLFLNDHTGTALKTSIIIKSYDLQISKHIDQTETKQQIETSDEVVDSGGSTVFCLRCIVFSP